MRLTKLLPAALGIVGIAAYGGMAVAEDRTGEQASTDPAGLQDAAPNAWAVTDYVVFERRVAQNVFLHAVAKAEEEHLWARWGPVHDCEQPGNWYAAGRTSHGYFEGGLGIEASLYRSIAGHSALQDSPIEQMRVAEVALSRLGPSAWACDVPF